MSVRITQTTRVVSVSDSGVRVGAPSVSPIVVSLSPVGLRGPRGDTGPAGIDFRITVSNTEPENPSVGDVWIQTINE